MKSRIKKRFIWLLPLALVLAVMFYVVGLFSAKLTFLADFDRIELHTLHLGEYHTQVQKLEITDKEGSTVVELAAKSEKSRMHTVTIIKGVNSFNDLYLEGYKIVYPGASPYRFKKGERYTAIVSWPFTKDEISFVVI